MALEHDEVLDQIGEAVRGGISGRKVRDSNIVDVQYDGGCGGGSLLVTTDDGEDRQEWQLESTSLRLP